MTMTTVPAGAQAETLEALRRRALDLCAARRHDSALLTLRSAIGLQPDSPVLLADLAGILLHAGQPAKAAEAARQALALDPARDMAAYMLALALPAGTEARSLLLELTQGTRARRFAADYPQLASHAQQALAEMPPPSTFTFAPAPAQAAAASTRFSGIGAAKYELSHLNQAANQDVGGPIQDDEALLLYALVRVMRVRRVLEVGGLDGYSARNFLTALGDETAAEVVTIDLNPVPRLAPNHRVLTGDCARIQPEQLGGDPFELVFFDAHVVLPQIALLDRLEAAGLLRPDTVVALHDTNLHPRKTVAAGYPITENGQLEGWVHQDAERKMVNVLHSRGWNSLSLHMPLARGDARLPVRHGLTLMQRFRPLAT
ncbi:class I SAM-dependent methyltransferase [Rubrivivax gelatinosus]|uniref:O-methyltransferase, family 3 n=1 Tax=Rubrivivax gelatinosus (strain NBRC 100245 / IL144) TaxID=983917 RepID=I0HPV5_RUBGI|nr:class I SAM-dependent methyltransferase [Rubrivivax gelatinosus]BAL95042.1 O-methyltransferase, family 3 [Rubrivivax gelatinosus IL144]